MVLNNQNVPTERRQFLERNGTQECDISLDYSEIKLDCCKIAKQVHEWDGVQRVRNPCDWFYICDIINLDCVLSATLIIVTCILILLALVLVCMVCHCTNDRFRSKANNLFGFPANFGRAEADSMEMRAFRG